MSAAFYDDSSSLYENKGVFLAHSIALEQEAADRLHELAETMAVHNNRVLYQLLMELAAYSETHAANIREFARAEGRSTLAGQGEPLPRFKAWEYFWPDDESPEIFHNGRVHYLMSVEDALLTALEVEQSAESFYRNIAKCTANPEVKTLAEQFAEEEQEHALAISTRLSIVKDAAKNAPSKALDQTDFDPPHMPE
ncbi:MAG: ferritin family protein [Gammaproteobacteria bacterium]|nr:ferritin family protein [Gammaproteobacteria bacterium]MBQ0839346.1 ferritin family protein [Gammaproteobacteria bacterium]